jgi:hypothetical protein
MENKSIIGLHPEYVASTLRIIYNLLQGRMVLITASMKGVSDALKADAAEGDDGSTVQIAYYKPGEADPNYFDSMKALFKKLITTSGWALNSSVARMINQMYSFRKRNDGDPFHTFIVTVSDDDSGGVREVVDDILTATQELVGNTFREWEILHGMQGNRAMKDAKMDRATFLQQIISTLEDVTEKCRKVFLALIRLRSESIDSMKELQDFYGRLMPKEGGEADNTQAQLNSPFEVLTGANGRNLPGHVCLTCGLRIGLPTANFTHQ